MGNLKLAHIIAIDKDSGEPVALVCNEHGYIRITLDTETVTVGGSVLPTGAATSAKQDIAKGVLDNIEAGIDEAKGLLGEVQASPTENTVLARLKDLLTGISLAAGSEVIGSVGIDPYTTTTAALTVSAAGDNTAISAPGAGKHLAIYRLVATVARGSEVNIILKSGATAKSGAMVADTYDIDFGDAPLICGTNEAFIVNLSAAVAVTGFVQYVEVTE